MKRLNRGPASNNILSAFCFFRGPACVPVQGLLFLGTPGGGWVGARQVIRGPCPGRRSSSPAVCIMCAMRHARMQGSSPAACGGIHDGVALAHSRHYVKTLDQDGEAPYCGRVMLLRRDGCRGPVVFGARGRGIRLRCDGSLGVRGEMRSSNELTDPELCRRLPVFLCCGFPAERKLKRPERWRFPGKRGGRCEAQTTAAVTEGIGTRHGAMRRAAGIRIIA